MKFGAIYKKQYTARFYDWTRTIDSEAGFNYEYTYKRDVVVDATTDGFGRLAVFFNDSDIRPMARLHDLRDSDGIEFIPNAVWVITNVQPVLNVLKKREGFRGDASWDYLDG